MKHAVFYGPHETTLDNKHRFLLPADLRNSIVPSQDGEAFIAIVGVNKKIWLFTENRYLEHAEQPLNMTPGDDEIAFTQLWYGTARKLKMDPNGRILVPDELLKKTGTENSIMVVGHRDHLQIWNRAEWRAREEELDAKRVTIAEAKAKQSAMMMPPKA
jgi:MraZ protein